MLRVTLIFSAAVMAAAPAAAASYSARLARPAEGRIVAREISWTCTAQSCDGATQESRPSVLCQALAKRAGRIDAFLVNGQALGTGELDKCNAAAKSAANGVTAAR